MSLTLPPLAPHCGGPEPLAPVASGPICPVCGEWLIYVSGDTGPEWSRLRKARRPEDARRWEDPYIEWWRSKVHKPHGADHSFAVSTPLVDYVHLLGESYVHRHDLDRLPGGTGSKQVLVSGRVWLGDAWGLCIKGEKKHWPDDWIYSSREYHPEPHEPDYRNDLRGGYRYVPDAPAYRADGLPRTLPPSSAKPPAEFAGFLKELAERRDLTAANASSSADRRRMVRAARHPWALVEPQRGFSLSVYVRPRLPRQLPGNRPYPTHPRTRQEASYARIHNARPPRHIESHSYELGENPDRAREEVFHDYVLSLDPFESAEPFANVLEPSGDERGGDRLLSAMGYNRNGSERSNQTRGDGNWDTCECVRRATRHAADLGQTLDALGAPYKPRPGQSDPLLDIRRAVAICLRLEGFEPGLIAEILRRDEKNVRNLTRDMTAPDSSGQCDSTSPHVEQLYTEVTDNWARRDRRGRVNEDSRRSESRWQKERAEIAAEVHGLRRPRGGPDSHESPWKS